MTDEELMTAFQAGDDAAFEQLYDRYKRAIFQYIYRRVGLEGRAEELTQEVFLGLLRSRGSWRQEASFKTYVYRIASNQCVSESRRGDFRKTEPLERPDGTTVAPPSPKEAPDAETTRREEAALVARALGELDEEQREALLMREYHGLSYEEIAGATGVALGTVKSRIFRGKLELWRLLEPVLGPHRGERGGAKIIPIRQTSR
jgi:RNA polymerase sigma-70 factor, ECF subfamily